MNREIEALRKRWTPMVLVSADLAFAKVDPVASYQGRIPPQPIVSPFGEFAGRADFRFLPLGATPANRTIERADLSGASDARGGQIAQCTLIECILDRASMETNIGEKFDRCTFVRAKLARSTFRGEFVDCDFSYCDLSYSGGSQVKFVRCSFTDAKLIGARFQHSRFDNCVWQGAKFGNAAFARGHFIGGWPSSDQLINAMTPGAIFEEAGQ